MIRAMTPDPRFLLSRVYCYTLSRTVDSRTGCHVAIINNEFPCLAYDREPFCNGDFLERESAQNCGKSPRVSYLVATGNSNRWSCIGVFSSVKQRFYKKLWIRVFSSSASFSIGISWLDRRHLFDLLNVTAIRYFKHSMEFLYFSIF